MPLKHRIKKRRRDELTSEQEQHLAWGCVYFLAPPALRFADEASRLVWSPFADDDERREAWSRHLAEIMAGNARYDRRPVAFWDYEVSWPEGAVGEAHAVHLLPDTPPEHRARIEQDWLRGVRISLLRCRDIEAARKSAERWHGVPGEAFDRHGPSVKATLDAARRAWREGVGLA
jgi:hypothetical protein